MRSAVSRSFILNIVKNRNEGFTLIELLVVIVIIGILAAISLPSFLNQVSKARQAEAKTLLGVTIRTQQSYLTEKKQFACGAAIAQLGLGFPLESENYIYAADCSGLGSTSVTNQAQPKSPALKAYLGGVSISTNATLLSTLCEAIVEPINGGATGNEVFGTGFTPNAFPVCPTGGSTGYISIN